MGQDIPIKTLLRRLASDNTRSPIERATIAHDYHESLQHVERGSIAMVTLFALGAAASCFDRGWLTGVFFAAGVGVGAYTRVAKAANREMVESLKMEYGEPEEP